jgi:hypothetical protein
VHQQVAAGVRVIKPPHALAFLDADLPRHGSRAADAIVAVIPNAESKETGA